MKVLLTGGSGFIGSHVLDHLHQAGHVVTAIGRSEAALRKLRSQGVQNVVAADLAETAKLSEAASQVDAVIHCGYPHELTFTGKEQEAAAIDQAAVEALAAGLAKSPSTIKRFLYASGLLSRTGSAESDPSAPFPPFPRSDETVLGFTDRGIKPLILRLAPLVHGPNVIHPFIGMQLQAAQKNGFLGYVEGSLWPAVHVDDAARLFLAALQASCPASVNLHGTAESGISTKILAEYLGQRLSLPVKAIDSAQGFETLGFAGILQSQIPVSNDKTRHWTGWQPREITMVEEMERNYKF